MKKLRIEIEQLQVDTFEIGDVPMARGTVRAHKPWTDPGYCAPTEDAYCTGGWGCSNPEFTCGGWQCQTHEAETCVPPTNGQWTCINVCA